MFITSVPDCLQADDKLCGMCEEGGNRTVASHWCRDCAEPLCDNCLKYHRLMKISRRHKIEEMEIIRRHPKRILSVPQPCPDHVGKDIELFCADHNTLCCVMCVATEHRRCEKVASIDKLSKQMEEGAVNEELVDKLDSYLEHLKELCKNREGNVLALTNKKNEVLEQINAYKENVTILLEKLEATITGEFTTLNAKETDKLKAEVEWCEAVQSAVDNAKSVLQMTNKHCSNAQVFITIQQVIERSIKYEDQLAKEQNERFEQVDYSFEIDPAFESFLQSLVAVESFGKINIHRRRASVPLSPGLKMLIDRNAEKVVDFDAKTQTDTRNCCLSSALFLSDRRILLADQNNQKIKLFQADGKFIYEQAFSTWPRDFTEIGNNRIAVTLPKERKIEIFYLGKKLKNLETIRLLDECWGITYQKGLLIVGCIRQEKGCLKVLTLDGTEVDSIEEDPEGKRLFIKTNYVTTSPSGKEIYITDRTKDTMIALAIRSTPTRQLTDDQGPKRVVLYKPKQRSSTALGVGAGADAGNITDRRGARSEIPQPQQAFTEGGKSTFDLRELRRELGEKAGTPTLINLGPFDEKLEDSYESQLGSSSQKDNKSFSADELRSVKTEDLDDIPLKPLYEREQSSSTSGDADTQEKAEYDVLFSYSNDILKSAGGVATDHEGNIYIAGYRSANVHQLSPGGSLIKILLHNLCQPLAIALEPYGEQLIVTETSTNRQNFVQIYKLV